VAAQVVEVLGPTHTVGICLTAVMGDNSCLISQKKNPEPNSASVATTAGEHEHVTAFSQLILFYSDSMIITMII